MARILIVEDDPSVRAFTARAFIITGNSVDTASDGFEGLEKIEAARGAFDLVLSDIRMPAIDGIEMARAAKKAFPAIRIVLMTGYAEQRERADDLDGVIADVISKPFSLKEIRDRVAAALDLPQAEAA